MNSAFYIARKIIRGRREKSLSNPIVNIAVLSVALSLAVMIIAVLSVQGFKSEIADKVSDFSGHIVISSFDNNASLIENPMYTDSIDFEKIKSFADVTAINHTAVRAAIMKAGNEINGIALKGYGAGYNWAQFRSILLSGRTINLQDSLTNDIIISQAMALQMNVDVNENVLCYFVQEPPRVRKFKVCGIFKTGLEEFDNHIIICDIRHIQKLNGWQPNQIGSCEIHLRNFYNIDRAKLIVNNASSYNLRAEKINDCYPQIFNWLQLINGNVIIILILMIIIACVNMIATLLILILDNTNTIGMLKALGATNKTIRAVFLYIALYLTIAGIVIGNIIGLGLCFIQQHYGLVKLPQDTYYLSVAPVIFDWSLVALLSLGTFITCTMFLLIPSAWVARIEPSRVIRFQ